MFRVKIQVPEELVSSYIEQIKTGIRGVGYVKTDDSAVWPVWLDNVIEAKPTSPTVDESVVDTSANQASSEKATPEEQGTEAK